MKARKIQNTNYLIKQLPKATAFINKKYQIIHASDQWISDFQFDSIDVIGKTILELFNDVSDDWKNVLKDCLTGKPGEIRTKRYIDSKEQEKWFRWTYTPWHDEQENVLGAIVQAEEVTQQIFADLKLEKLEVLLREKSEIAQIGTWEFDALTSTVHWCDMSRKIHGAAPDFVPTLANITSFYKEGNNKNAFSMALYEATEKGSSWSEKLQIALPGGQERWILAAGKPVLKNSEFMGLIGTFQDITHQELSEIETKKNERLLQTLIDNIPINIYIKDRNSRKILVNKAECDYLGVANPEELLGKSDFDLYDKEIAEISRNEDLSIFKTMEPLMSQETLNVKKDGTETTFLTSKIPLKDNFGKPIGLVGISLDISNLKKQEEELRDLIQVTSLQNTKLIDFAHIVSHNLRSHTANFSMLLDFLIHETDEGEKQNILKMLTTSSDHLLETLDNLNEVIAINTNINLDKKRVNLNQGILKAKKNLHGFLVNNNAKIINTISDDVYLKVIPSYLDSIVLNLITNAVKYGFPGRRPIIKLSAKSKDGYTMLRIEDNGSGIDLDKYGNKIFGMYKTFHTHKDARGIGLYITKNQIEAMKGKIKVKSIVNVGTTFKVYFNDKA